MEVATEHSKGKGVTTRIDVEKRFLFDWVALERTNIAERDLELPVLQEAHFADAAPPFAQETPVAASHTADTISLRVPERTGCGVVIQNVSLNFVCDRQFHGGLCMDGA